MRSRSTRCTLALLSGLLVACAEPRDEALIDEVFDDPVVQRPVSEPVRYLQRGGERGYGLPREGQPGIADLIAVMPSESVEDGDADIWAAAGDEPACPDRVATRDALPMTVEGVVTLHPRQYLKVPVCDQDERNYGSFVVEDDTGGIVVLRNSRVAEFSAGDRVRMTVRSTMFTFRNPSTRLVLAADVERLDPPTGARGIVYYTPTRDQFSVDDVTVTRRIEGYVVQAPNNTNFGQLVLASEKTPVPPPDAGEGTVVCQESCPTRCRRRQCGEACRTICDALCADGADTTADLDARLPTCWPANIDQELQRRGFGPALGTRLALYGPVFDSFDIEMWIQRLGQVEVLAEPGEGLDEE